jgi:hypothetical protein
MRTYRQIAKPLERLRLRPLAGRGFLTFGREVFDLSLKVFAFSAAADALRF